MFHHFHGFGPSAAASGDGRQRQDRDVGSARRPITKIIRLQSPVARVRELVKGDAPRSGAWRQFPAFRPALRYPAQAADLHIV